MPRRRDFFIFLIFLVLSGLFWLSTALNGYYDYEMDIPLAISGVPDNLVQTSEEVEVVRVTIHDKGFQLLQYVRNKALAPLELNYSTYKSTSNRCLVPASELHKLISKRLANSTVISAVKPEKIELNYIEGVAKRVPVRIVGTFIPAKNYYLERTQVSPSQVMVYASAKEIDSIAAVETERWEVDDFADTVVSMVKIAALPNTKVVPSEVRVSLCPDILTQEEIEVEVSAVNVPSGVVLRTFPSRVKVRFTVGASMYRKVDFSQFKVEADYDDISLGADKCCISLTEIPTGVKTATLEIDEVDYLIEN